MNSKVTITPRLGIARVLCLCSALALIGCEKEKGPLEKAGEKMDEAVNDTKRAIQDAAD